ncbi:RTA1 like protein-domain-containing protein [Fusarium oxysporum]|nr:RTA1 like protein-domain-containing protein [Fusarium oxysporum]
MSNTTEAPGQLTQEQVDTLKKGCHSLVQGIDTSYGYVPTLGVGIVFCALFSLSILGHFIQFSRKRECPYNNNAFLMQIITLIIALTFFTAGLYVILGALINRLGRQSSMLGPRMYAIVFLTCDVIALIVQAVGGAMASRVAGIVFQMAAMVVFTVLVIDFLRRVFLKKTYLQGRKLEPANCNNLPKAYTWLLVAVFVSLFMIFIRSWEGYLITHEGYFISLDGATMVVAVGIFNFLDPVFLLWGQDDKLTPAFEQNELRERDVRNERWDDSATVTD